LGAALDLDDDLLELVAGPALPTLAHFGHSCSSLLFLGLGFALGLALRLLALRFRFALRLAALRRRGALGRRALLFLLRLLGRLLLRLPNLRRLVLLLRVEEEVQPALGRRLGERADAAVEAVVVPVEHHLRDALGLCARGQLR